MAMKKISNCVNENVEWLEYNNDGLCDTLKENRQTDEGVLNIINYVYNVQFMPSFLL